MAIWEKFYRGCALNAAITITLIMAFGLPAFAQNDCPHEYLVFCPIEQPIGTELEEGKATIEYAVEEDGSVANIVVVSSEGDRRVERALINSVKQWQYLPAAETEQSFSMAIEFSED